jgi:repressor LexA
MTPREFKTARRTLGLTQEQLAQYLKTTRMTITRYECGTHQIPGAVEVALGHLAQTQQVPLAGIVAAGDPIEPVLQSERVEVPASMLRSGEHFALKIKGTSMKEDGILPNDIVVIHKQQTARNGQTVIALVNGEATIKRYFRKPRHIELHPANDERRPIIVQATDDFRVEGVVVGLIRYCE